MTLRQAIQKLKLEADNAGNDGQVNTCAMALFGDQIAIEACLRVIREAQDQA